MRKVLVVEDDKFLRKIIKKKLTTEGYEVIEAVDGEEGIRMAKGKKPDIILLDLVLPEMTGFEVLTKLKEKAPVSEIPVIILSNLSGTEEIRKGIKMGASDYLVKAHFNPSEIIIKMELIFKKIEK